MVACIKGRSQSMASWMLLHGGEKGTFGDERADILGTVHTSIGRDLCFGHGLQLSHSASIENSSIVCVKLSVRSTRCRKIEFTIPILSLNMQQILGNQLGQETPSPSRYLEEPTSRKILRVFEEECREKLRGSISAGIGPRQCGVVQEASDEAFDLGLLWSGLGGTYVHSRRCKPPCLASHAPYSSE